MKVIPDDYERIWWRLFQMIMNVPDEGYSRWLWTYLMKVIPDDYERIWWRLFQMIMNVSDEGYSRCALNSKATFLSIQCTRYHIYMYINTVYIIHCCKIYVHMIFFSFMFTGSVIRAWIGLFDPTRQHLWKWVSDQSRAIYVHWAPGEPNYRNEKCAEMFMASHNGEWNNLPCTAIRQFICETSY
jgi:hypothetical protein